MDATEGGATGLFTVHRSSDVGALTVNYATPTGTATNSVDYAGAGTTGGSVSFASGETTKPISIAAVDDTDVEGTETVIVALASGSGYTVTGGAASINIFDNDVAPPPGAPVVVSVSKFNDAAEGRTNGEFVFTRTGDTTQNLTVTYTVNPSASTATPSTDYQPLSGTVTIAAGWATAFVS